LSYTPLRAGLAQRKAILLFSLIPGGFGSSYMDAARFRGDDLLTSLALPDTVVSLLHVI
jgi:hypothetical protein